MGLNGVGETFKRKTKKRKRAREGNQPVKSFQRIIIIRLNYGRALCVRCANLRAANVSSPFRASPLFLKCTLFVSVVDVRIKMNGTSSIKWMFGFLDFSSPLVMLLNRGSSYLKPNFPTRKQSN